MIVITVLPSSFVVTTYIHIQWGTENELVQYSDHGHVSDH